MKGLHTLCFMGLLSVSLMSQPLTRVSMDKGQRFIAAFAPFEYVAGERPTANPLQIIATSEYDAVVRFRTIDVDGVNSFDTTIRIEDVVGSGKAVLNVPPELVISKWVGQAKYGIEITSDVPISVTTRRMWMGGGEDAQILPVEHLGTDYYAFAMPSDVFGSNELTWTSGYIVVIGTVDNTIVTVHPKVNMPPNAPYTFTINAGDVVMLDHEVDTNSVHTPLQDLTGTRIVSDKPIGVLSGHLKGAVGTKYRVLPPQGALATSASFVRNNLVEMMPPTSMADTVYVASPFAYTAIRTGFKHLDSFDCMVLGDIVRFVATSDNTLIYCQRAGETQRTLIGSIQTGEFLDDSSLFKPTVYWSTKPVLAAQYGRSYANIDYGETRKRADQGQGRPSVESGMPMMAMLVPVSRWVTSASWTYAEGKDNFCSIILRTADTDWIEYNGRPLSKVDSVEVITNTPFSRFVTRTLSDVNLVRATKNGVRFSVLPHYSLDGLTPGSSGAYSTGYDRANAGSDTIKIVDIPVSEAERFCGVRESEASLTGPNAIASIFPKSRRNYSLTVTEFFKGAKNASYRLEPIDASKPAQCTMCVLSSSGTVVEYAYTHEPQSVEVVASPLPSNIGVGVEACIDISITNTSNTALELTGFSLLEGGDLTVDADLPITIAPGKNRNVQCCFTPQEIGVVDDTIVATSRCYNVHVSAFNVNVISPEIRVDDATFGVVAPTSSPQQRSVAISNTSSDVSMNVVAIRWAHGVNDTHFTFDTSGLALPNLLGPTQSLTIHITYDPSGDSGLHTAKIRVMSSSTGSDSVIFCTAESKTVSSVEEESAVINLHPVPVRIGGTLQAQLPPSATVRVVDLQGRELDRRSVSDNGQLEIHVSADRYHVGVYHLVVTTPDSVKTYRWIIE